MQCKQTMEISFGVIKIWWVSKLKMKVKRKVKEWWLCSPVMANGHLSLGPELAEKGVVQSRARPRWCNFKNPCCLAALPLLLIRVQNGFGLRNKKGYRMKKKGLSKNKLAGLQMSFKLIYHPHHLLPPDIRTAATYSLSLGAVTKDRQLIAHWLLTFPFPLFLPLSLYILFSRLSVH